MSKKVLRGASIAALLAAALLGISTLIKKEEQIIDNKTKELKTEIVETATKAKTSSTPITRNSTWSEALSQIEKLAQKRARLNKLKEQVNETIQLFNERKSGKKSIAERILSRKSIRTAVDNFNLIFGTLSQLNEEELKIWIKLQNHDALNEEEETKYINEIKPKFASKLLGYFQTKVINGFWSEEDPYEPQSYLVYANDSFITFLEKAKHDLITGIEAIEESLKIINPILKEIESEEDQEKTIEEEAEKLYNVQILLEETLEDLKDDLVYVEQVIGQRKAMKF